MSPWIGLWTKLYVCVRVCVCVCVRVRVYFSNHVIYDLPKAARPKQCLSSLDERASFNNLTDKQGKKERQREKEGGRERDRERVKRGMDRKRG